MKLSLKMIAERLETQVRVLKFKDIYSTVRLDKPVFLTDETELQANTLYISASGRLPAELTYQDGCALILTGDIFTDVLNCPALILIKDREDIFRVHNLVCSIFDTFNAWERSLRYTYLHYSRRQALESLLEASAGIFDNPMAVYDASMEPLVLSYPHDPALPIHTQAKAVEALPKSLHSHKAAREVFVLVDPALPHRIMIRNIFSGGALYYRLTIAEQHRPFRETDYLLLEMLAGFLEKIVRKDSGIPISDSAALASILTDGIGSDIWNKPLLETELDSMGWTLQDCYQILYITSAGHHLPQDSIAYYCTEINRRSQNVFAFGWGGSVTILIHPDAQDDTGSVNLTELTQFLREHSLRAGISNPFTGLCSARRFYQQAVSAYEIGCQEHPEEPLSAFSDCVLLYLLDTSREFEQEDLLSPIYRRLRDHDHQNHTEYLKTLREYLAQHMNAVQTAQSLYIHRATLIYRIKRICEIGQTDLKDPQELLHLMISFYMTRHDPLQ